MIMQLDLFAATAEKKTSPLVVSYGAGVDSTAMLVGFVARGIRPDLILFADTGAEKEETYTYLPIMNAYLKRNGFPEIVTVTYKPKDFKNWPPYASLEENCLTNGTLPSMAFGFGSCSLKWKVQPQDKYVKAWAPARECWAHGGKVRKAIGYDSGEGSRCTYAKAKEDPRFEYIYPLIEWAWKREECEKQIARAGLPVPPKSSCFFCPSMRPCEVAALPPEKLKRIVAMEARAKPRLLKIKGLWRKGVKGMRGATRKPARMSDYIREEGLLDAESIDQIEKRTPKDIVLNQERFVKGKQIPAWSEFLGAL